jgi:polar amino acid transport system permease protein
MRVVLPPTGNEVISMLKATSLVSVLAISDLLYSAQIIYSLNYRTIPLLIVASFWYLLMTSISATSRTNSKTTTAVGLPLRHPSNGAGSR